LCTAMKRILAFLFCAVALTWSGCSKDDGGAGTGRLIGKWLLVSEYDEWINGQGEIEGEYDPYELEDSFYIEFQTNSTGTIWWDPFDVTDTEEFSYQYDSSSSLLYWLDGGLSEEPPYIEKLSSSELVMTWYSQVSGYRLSEKAIFRRAR
jgi:hypothetical protein